MRLFYLQNELGNRISLNNETGIFLTEPEGLGLEFGDTFADIGEGFFRMVSKKHNQRVIGGKLNFMKDPYKLYNDFVNWCMQAKQLYFIYRPIDVEYYIHVEIESFQKTEINQLGYLEVPIRLKYLSPWYVPTPAIISMLGEDVSPFTFGTDETPGSYLINGEAILNQKIYINPFVVYSSSNPYGTIRNARGAYTINQDGSLKINFSAPSANISFGFFTAVQVSGELEHKKLYISLNGLDQHVSNFDYYRMIFQIGSTVVSSQSVNFTEDHYEGITELDIPSGASDYYITVLAVRKAATSETSDYFTIQTMQVIDLTEMFGEGKEPSLEAFRQVYNGIYPRTLPGSTVYSKVEDVLIGSSSASYISEIHPTGHLPPALKVTIKGECSNPVIKLIGTETGIEYGKCSINYSFSSGSIIELSTMYEDSYIKSIDILGNETDLLQYVDLTSEPFFKAPLNEICNLTITDSESLSGQVDGFVYFYYRSI